jgi:flagellar basal-body rod protein FlgF
MDSGYYAAFSGLLARTQALDVVANNLANVNTTGYKSQHEFYDALTASQENASLSPINQAANRFGVLGGNFVDVHAGPFEPTGNSLDLSIQKAGFFAVQTKSGVRYTRNWNFQLNSARQLVTKEGDPVLGIGGPTMVTDAPITVPPGEPSVSADGTLSVAGTLAGQLRVVELTQGAQLAPEGNSYFLAPAGSVHPSLNPEVQQGSLEGSNMNPVAGTVALIAIQRSAQMMERALSIFNNDFNRTAAEQVARD